MYSTGSAKSWASSSSGPLSRFSDHFQGLDQRLTGVEPAKVVKELLA